MKKTLLFALIILFSKVVSAQATTCTFKPPFLTIHFGNGDVPDVNRDYLSEYERVETSCPSDGYYTYTSFTSRCFRDDWHTLEDHTPGAGGNMLLVNAADNSGVFLSTTASGFKGNTKYEFGAWLMNVCIPSEKCGFPLLPNLTITLQTLSGRTIARFNTGDIGRVATPQWTQHRAQFTMPAGETAVKIVMRNNTPGGCGNDFALDDITFRECVPVSSIVKAPARVVEEKKVPPVIRDEARAVTVVKKQTPPPAKKEDRTTPVAKAKAEPVTRRENTVSVAPSPLERKQVILPAPPPALTRRQNPLVKTLEVEKGEIRLDLYDNGEIDGDTVSIYHNNTLLVSRARLSQKPITFRIPLSVDNPHHELVMVAENLGSIPPNTSVLIVTAGDKRYQVFITSTEQKNAKVVLELKD